MPSVGSNNQTSKVSPGLCAQTAGGLLSDPGLSRIPRYGKSLSSQKASKAATVQDHTMDGERKTNKSKSEICHEKRLGREDDNAQGSTLERNDKCRPVKGTRMSKLPVPTPNGNPTKLIISKSATEGDLLSCTHKWTVITRYSSAPNLCGKSPSRIPVRVVKGSKRVGSVCVSTIPGNNYNILKETFRGRDVQSPPVSEPSRSIAKHSINVSPPPGSSSELVCNTLEMLADDGVQTGNLTGFVKDDNQFVVTTPFCVSHTEKCASIQSPSTSELNYYHHTTLDATVRYIGGGELSTISKTDNKPLDKSLVVYKQSSILLLAAETDCSSDSGAGADKEKTFTSKSLLVKVDTTEAGGLAHKQSDPAMEQDSGIALSRSTLLPSQSASILIVSHETECSSESGSDGDVKKPVEEPHKANEWNGSTQSTAVICGRDGEEESELSSESTGIKDPDTSEFIRMCRTYNSAPVCRFPAAASSGSFPRKRKTRRRKSIESLNDSKSALRSSSDEESDDQRQQHPGDEETLLDNPGKENTFLRCQNQLLRQTNSSLRADNRIILKRLEDEGNKGKLLEEKSCRLRTRVKCLKRKMKVVKTKSKKRQSDWKELDANLNGKATCSNMLIQNLRCLLKMSEETAEEQNKKLQQVHAIIDLQNTELKKATVFMALHKALQRLAEIVADQKNQLRLTSEQTEEQAAKLQRRSELIAHQELELKRADGETVNLKNQLHLKDKQIKEQTEKLQRESEIISRQELELKRADEETVDVKNQLYLKDKQIKEQTEKLQRESHIVAQRKLEFKRADEETVNLKNQLHLKDEQIKEQKEKLQRESQIVAQQKLELKRADKDIVNLKNQLHLKDKHIKEQKEKLQRESDIMAQQELELKRADEETVNHLEAMQNNVLVVTQQEKALQEALGLLEKQKEREGDLKKQVDSLQQNLSQEEERLIKEITQNSVLQDQLTVVSNKYKTCRWFEQETATRNECLEEELGALKETVYHLEAKQNKAAVVTQQEKAVQENREQLQKQRGREGELEEQVGSLQMNLLEVKEKLIEEINLNSLLQDQLTVVSTMYKNCRKVEQETATRNKCLENELEALTNKQEISTCEGSCAGEETENKTHGLLSKREEESLVSNEADGAKKTEGNSSRFSMWLLEKCSRLKQMTSKFESNGSALIEEKEAEEKELRREMDRLKREVAHKDKELDMMESSLEEIGKMKNLEIKRLKQSLRRLQEENAWLSQSPIIPSFKG